jgi:hypothetical protein
MEAGMEILAACVALGGTISGSTGSASRRWGR